MKKVTVVAKQFINFGKQPDGSLLWFRPNEPKEVELTDVIANAVEHGLLEIVEEVKPKKTSKKKKEIVEGGTIEKVKDKGDKE